MPAGHPQPARSWRLYGLAATLTVALAGSGCGNLPREQLAQCHNRSQLLQAEASRLKDDSTQLRAKNRELAQRAVEDARRLRSMEEANRRLEKSVVAYQDERDQVQRAFDDLKRELIAAAEFDTRRADLTPDAEPVRTALAAAPMPKPEPEPLPEPEPKLSADEPAPLPNASAPHVADDSPPAADTTLPDALAAFLQEQPDTRLEGNGRSWTVPASRLFEPGADTLSPRGAFLLARFARMADSTGVRPRTVTASPDVEPVQRTSAEGNPDGLPDRRALAVRNHLASLLQTDRDALPARVGSETDADGRNPAPALTIDLDLPR